MRARLDVKMPQTMWFNQKKYIFSQFWKLDI